MFENKELFVLSEIKDKKLLKFKDNMNKKVIGKMKLEYVDYSNSVIEEFIGLKSKMYSIKFDEEGKEEETTEQTESEEWNEKEEDREKEEEKDKEKYIKEVKTAKRIVKSVIKKNLKHEMYKNILETGKRRHDNMTVIRSVQHQLYTMEINKVSLSAYDDKRYLLDDGITSYAYCHYKTLKASF